MSKDELAITLPYHADIKILEKILNDLKTGGKEGVKLETLWANIGASNDKHRSYTMNLGKYLELVDNDSTRAWLTDFGTTLRYMTKNEKNLKLAQKLPSKYMTMFKWIMNKHEMRSNELKTEFIGTWGNIMSSAVLDRAITTFLNYCNWIGIIIYQGRGNQAKAILTDFGKRVLDSSPDESPHSRTEPDEQRPPKKDLLNNTTYPVIITTNDRGDFHWDIKSEADWKVIDSVIASIKEGWKIKQPENSSSHIKGEKDSIEPT